VLRGDLPADDFRDVVLALLFLRCASARRKGAIKVPDGCSFGDLVTLAATRASAQTFSSRILTPFLVINGIDPMPGLSTLDRWPRSSIKKLISLFADADLKWGDKLWDSQIFDVFWALSEDGGSRKQLGLYSIPNEITAAIASEIIKARAPEKALELYDPFCGDGRLLASLSTAWGQRSRVRIFGQTQHKGAEAYITMNLLLRGNRNIRIEQADPIQSPFTTDKGAPVDLAGTPPLQLFDIVASDLSGKITPNAADLAGDRWHRFIGHTFPGKFSGFWTAIRLILASQKPGGCGACVISQATLHAGGVEGGFLANLHNTGALEATIELPAFGQSEKPRYLVVLRNSRRGGV